MLVFHVKNCAKKNSYAILLKYLTKEFNILFPDKKSKSIKAAPTVIAPSKGYLSTSYIPSEYGPKSTIILLYNNNSVIKIDTSSKAVPP